ncbi:MAG TPA: methyltransferase domain-containing protein [Acidimicrobiia bacterium]|nr:methyltransferase domain-containing protein [Acidimicrobiia bacterium]
MTTTLHSLDTAATGLALFDAAGLRPGARVLDVGCGRGSTTLTAARRVGGSGLVLGVDACLTMLEDARRRVAAAALRHVGFVHGDAQTQRFAPLRFDVIVIAGGLSVFADADAGVANLSHALLRGGTLALAAPNDHERVRAVVERAGLVDGDDATPGVVTATAIGPS